jgi:hypothetical protein
MWKLFDYYKKVPEITWLIVLYSVIEGIIGTLLFFSTKTKKKGGK